MAVPYAQLHEEALGYAANLQALGVQTGDHVALLGALTDITMAGAAAQCRRHRVLLVGATGAGQVQVHEVRPDPR